MKMEANSTRWKRTKGRKGKEMTQKKIVDIKKCKKMQNKQNKYKKERTQDKENGGIKNKRIIKMDTAEGDEQRTKSKDNSG